jgi:hypothetical protein
MADLKISQLTAATVPLNGTETLPLVQSGTTKKVAVSEVGMFGPAFSAYQSISQAIPSTTWTKVQLQTKEFDTNTAFDSTTNYRFQPTIAGYYQVNCGIAVTTGASQVVCSVYKNASPYKIGSIPAGSIAFANTTSALVYLNGSTDYIEFYAYFSIGQGSSAAATDTFFQASMTRRA